MFSNHPRLGVPNFDPYLYGNFLGWVCGVPQKWMVYSGKSNSHGWFGGSTVSGNLHMFPLSTGVFHPNSSGLSASACASACAKKPPSDASAAGRSCWGLTPGRKRKVADPKTPKRTWQVCCFTSKIQQSFGDSLGFHGISWATVVDNSS